MLARLWLEVRDIKLREYEEDTVSLQKAFKILNVSGKVSAREMDKKTFQDKPVGDTTLGVYKFSEIFSH